VVLGPKTPDKFEYDALVPGGGLLVWHIDATNIPFETGLRVPSGDYGFNSGPGDPAITIIEADGLADIGDPGSPFFLGSPYDPWFKSNDPLLSDTSDPNLRPHIGTRPHIQLDFLDDQAPTMHFQASRTWQLPGWPVTTEFPPGGPLLLAVDADGAPGGALEVCWAGGPDGTADSTALYAVRLDGQGLFGPAHAFANLDRRPRPLMAALPTGAAVLGGPPLGPSYFAVSTYADPPSANPRGGGQVCLIDHTGQPLPGWPAVLPSKVTTPPVIAGTYPNAFVYVGCENGHVYAIELSGQVDCESTPAIFGPVAGRLAVAAAPASLVGVGQPRDLVAAGGADGEVAVYVLSGPGPGPSNTLAALNGWPDSPRRRRILPDFVARFRRAERAGE
jgi:hypothetical protein